MPHTGPFAFSKEWMTLKIKFERTALYREECEATISGDDPAAAIEMAEYDTFLITRRSLIDMNVTDIEQLP